MKIKIRFSQDCIKHEIPNVSSGIKKLVELLITLSLTFCLTTGGAQAEEYRYRLVSLKGISYPSGFSNFAPVSIDNFGVIYGTVYKDNTAPYIAVFKDGILNTCAQGTALVGNSNGIGGFIASKLSGNPQAALFSSLECDSIRIIKYKPGDTQSMVVSLNERNISLVQASNPRAPGVFSYRIYKNNLLKHTFFSAESDYPPGWKINAKLIVSGNGYDKKTQKMYAVRYLPKYTNKKTKYFFPLEGDSFATAMDLNESGEVLMSSSAPEIPDNTRTRFGVWDLNNKFTLYADMKEPYVGIFNNRRIIVLSTGSQDTNSYLVTEPGKMTNLLDLIVSGDPIPDNLFQVTDINDQGDIIGVGWDDDAPYPFLLKRIQ